MRPSPRMHPHDLRLLRPTLQQDAINAAFQATDGDGNPLYAVKASGLRCSCQPAGVRVADLYAAEQVVVDTSVFTTDPLDKARVGDVMEVTSPTGRVTFVRWEGRVDQGGRGNVFRHDGRTLQRPTDDDDDE